MALENRSDAADAAADLVGERLEREPVIRRGEGRRERVRRAARFLRRLKNFDRVFKTALEQMLVAVKGDEGT